MNKNPVNGMKDICPNEMEIRQYLLNKIRNIYVTFGFMEIQTPIVEHIENLSDDNISWENEKLIFKILKRGEKLSEALEKNDVKCLADSGLRYDLTLPLSRFYANNRDVLPKPFKSIQIGSVFRADRPQKGRFREFTQCDIDILGDNTNLAEIECLVATLTFLKSINFEKYGISIDINDRRLLKKSILDVGFKEEDIKEICIILDKMDKIGLNNVKQELLDKSFDKDHVDALYNNIEKLLEKGLDLYDDYEEDGVNISHNLKFIINTVSKITSIPVNYNSMLVRGMGYYTGPIFEIKCEAFNSSIGGGGRYDHMINGFIKEDIPACGISIGFERLITILMDNNYQLENTSNKIAYLIDKNLDDDKKLEILQKAYQERLKGNIIYISNMAKNIKFQKENLSQNGFNQFVDYK